ncbi:MAG: methyltransferase domain-containing protein [Acidimicrobiia bacterium]|nr:methyltransferase domain-containing protein [Acidimicrobiia bacterium]
MPHEVYTHSHDQVVVDAHGRRTAEEAADFVRPYIRPQMRILDAGCGPGSITCGLARWVPDGEVVGIDAAASVLEHGRSRANTEGVDNVSFQLGDAYDLAFPDGSFDVVYAHQLLQHLGRPVDALGEFLRVLKPGGHVAVRDADYGTMTHHPVDARVVRLFEIYGQVARCNRGEPDAGRRLLSWVQAAGFSSPVYTTSSWQFATQEGRTWWADLWAGRTGVTKYVERVEELGLSTAEELAELGTGFQDWATNPGGVFIFINGEVVARA